MKRQFLTLLFSAAAFCGVNAQNIDGEWTDGIVFYTVQKDGNNYRFDGFLGEDRSFTISKTATNQFVIKEESEEEYYSLGKNGYSVKYISLTESSGRKAEILASYSPKKQLFYAIQKDLTPNENFYETGIEDMFEALLGRGTFEPFSNEYSSNKSVTIRISGKVYVLKTTSDGITLYNSEFKDLADRPTTVYKTFKYKDSGQGWWPQTSKIVLNISILHLFDKQQLRLMRNEIYARHGWEFQSEDLKKHFSQFSWYKPLGNNNSIKLSDLEQFNVDLIKSMESFLK